MILQSLYGQVRIKHFGQKWGNFPTIAILISYNMTKEQTKVSLISN